MSADDSSTGDDATGALFGGGDAPAPGKTYEVLARKYRPRRFEDLIGQEAMVRTLSNAFETGRIAHGFMLTGVRGVGKTTTARLLARGLNYEPKADAKGKKGKAAGPSIHLDPPGEHCDAIMASRHPDVLELDAASRTGVADMRDLLDSARYGPVSARYKVYIIDEVHMLSNASFNALLKTLEEPPPHLKFIFATTEIRKVPVTVLSRCQRFDLKRLDSGELSRHLGNVAQSEGANVSEEALALIARAAEGSVRDGLSLLDQGIVQTTDGEEVSGAAVRAMLGLGDRARLLDAVEKAVGGDAKGALAEVREQVAGGADPAVILKDILDIAADISVAQATGDDWTQAGPADWANRTRALAQRLTPAQAARNWQLLLSGYGDLQVAPDPATALNMVILRLAAASTLPSPEEAARMIAEGSRPPGKDNPPLKAPPQAPGGIESFADMIAIMVAAREVGLQVDTERFVRPSHFEPGKLACALAPGAPQGLLGRLKIFLETYSDLDWSVEEADTDTESVRERERREKAERIESAKQDPRVAAALALIPGAIILDVEDPPELLEMEGGEGDVTSNVIPLKTRRPA
ncbi:DNA polymerase III, subunits gamma and tau [Hyphomonas neptunium ATCC 15444]|uniref:DNA polymerase III subunit gamma/tau n=2 Tax=Hyphomonas TaxID=85 RepID=Q0C591_HYPNA|nr:MULTISPECIES: DNA polymerase III subunit gamma/tau [Hyphomonas]ABI76697.1 DNA polymerase III, subunits gamma and tau [Hyphomonas neptunium ATCC 15444]KCZ95535.1 DNA polymerase III subunits gamma and tau [Hyphomonas hirschiana VP5]